MKIGANHRRGKRVTLALAAATAMVAFGAVQTRADNAGVDNLMAAYPVLDFTGNGLNVAQVEGDSNGLNTYEVNPAVANQPASLFTYIDETGNVSNTYSGADGSTHANTVGRNFYGGVGEGVAPGVAHVDNYDADYFVFSMVAPSSGPQLPTLNNDKIISESFAIEAPGEAGLADQKMYDTDYDTYEINFPATILVSAVGYSDPSMGVNQPFSPGTAYNGIAVNADAPGGNQVTGPTLDGRDKPDIEAPPQTGGEETSYATPRVAGASAILVEAGARGDANGASGLAAATVESDSVDPRVVKALLMNGANKPANWSTGVTSTSPLNPVSGAGDLNVYGSYLNLRGGEHTYSFSSSQPTNVATPLTSEPVAPIDPAVGWSFSNILTTNTTSEVNHYRINAVGTGTTTLTATLDWWRNPTLANYSAGNPINNLFLYLYDITAASFVSTSVSIVDNVQEIYANVNSADNFDLMVMKPGGAPGKQGVVSAQETYALAWSLAEIPSSLVTSWNNPNGSSWAVASNWTGNTIPNAAGAQARLTAGLINTGTVTLDGNRTVGSIVFYDNASYTVASGSGGGTLTLDNAGTPSVITVNTNNHTISAPVNLTTFGATTDILGGASLTFTGNISGIGSLTNTGGGELTLSASNSFTGQTINDSGTTLVAAAAGSLPTGTMVFNNGSLVVNSSSSVGAVSGSGTLSIAGGQSFNTSNFSQGTLVNNGTFTMTGTGTVSNISGTGVLTFAPNSRLTIAPNGSTVAMQNGVTFQGSGASEGTLDITSNSMVINYGGNHGSYNSAVETAIRAAIINGFDGGAWNGNGITSSTAQADAANPSDQYGGNAAVGYVDNNFLGRTDIPTDSVLFRFTYYGDSDLNGEVDVSDFQNWLAGYQNQHSDPTDFPINWIDGDFLYENHITTNGFQAWLSSYQAHLGNLSVLEHDIDVSTLSEAQQQELMNIIAAVPEPASVGLLGIASMGLLARRRSAKPGSRRSVTA